MPSFSRSSHYVIANYPGKGGFVTNVIKVDDIGEVSARLSRSERCGRGSNLTYARVIELRDEERPRRAECAALSGVHCGWGRMNAQILLAWLRNAGFRAFEDHDKGADERRMASRNNPSP